MPKLFLPPNSDGLFFREEKNRWYVTLYTVKGKRVCRSLGVSDKKAAKRNLASLGFEKLPSSEAEKASVDPDIYIHEIKKPYTVRIQGLKVGSYKTKKEARIARDNALGITK